MASHHQDHDVLELLRAIMSAGKSLEEQLKSSKAALKSLEEKFEEQKVQLEKTEGSFNKLQVLLQENMNQLLALRASALPSNISPLSHQADSSASMSLQLRFKGKVPNTILTKNNIEDEGAILTVELCDNTGKRVEVGPELCFKGLKVKFSVLDGDFEVEDTDDWTEDDFNMNVATPRKDKAPLLKGNCEISLSEGAARVCGISFTDNSKSTTKNGFLRLGAQVTKGLPSGLVVRPAVSEAFQVKEYRLKSDQKHEAPLPEDELYRLKNISKTGEIYRRAQQKDIIKVMDFLQLYHTDASELQSILNVTGMRWKETVDNAERCNLTNERYKYVYHDEGSGDVLILKSDFRIESVTFNGQTSQPYGSLDQSQKEKAGIILKAAYKKRKELDKVYDSIDQIPVQAEPGYPSYVEQQEPEEQEQQQPAPLNLDPSVPYVVSPSDQQICSGPSTNSYLGTAEANHVSFHQDVMTASGSLISGKNGVQEMWLNQPPSALPSNVRQLLHMEGLNVSKTLQLHFELQSQPLTKIFTLKSMHEHGICLKLVLRDESGNIVEAGAESSLKIKIVVLNGDFSGDVRDGVTGSKFHENVLKQRENKPPLLAGKHEITLRNGIADVGDIMFTDNSSWMRSKRFRLGAKVAKSVSSGVIIKEAISEAFMVKERRGEFYQKKMNPTVNDEVWRLQYIAKDGKIHRRLEKEAIKSVSDLLQRYFEDGQSLRKILVVPERKFQSIIKHASSAYINQPGYYTGPDEEKVDKLRKVAYEKQKELNIEDDSTNQTLVEAGLKCPSSVTQQEPEEQEQQTAHSSMYPNVPYVVSLSDQICGGPSTSVYPDTTAANHVSFQQNTMNAARSLITGDYGGDNSSVAYEYQTEQVADNGLDSHITAANQAEQKHETPLPADFIYCLICISKSGAIHRRALENDVVTVMDFLQLYYTDASKLQSILGVTGMRWKCTVNHAQRCNLTNECYKYIYHDDESGDVLILKCDFKIESVTFKGQTRQPYESLDESQKLKAVKLRKAAYDKRKELRKVYDSINQIPVLAGSGYQLDVEQQGQQPPAPPSDMDSSAVGSLKQICSNPAANHGKRGTEDAIEKAVSVKKQKVEQGEAVIEADFRQKVA